jgi:hypothetical protein
MHFVRVRSRDLVTLAFRKRARFFPQRAVREHEDFLSALARLAQQNGIFAVSEICRGLVIFGVGDIVTADGLGELIGVTAQSVHSLARFDFHSWFSVRL